MPAFAGMTDFVFRGTFVNFRDRRGVVGSVNLVSTSRAADGKAVGRIEPLPARPPAELSDALSAPRGRGRASLSF